MIFHPLLVPTYLGAVLLWAPHSEAVYTVPAHRWPLLAVVWAGTFLLPAAGTYALVRTGRASSLLLPDHRERSGPLLLALAGFVVTAGVVRGAAPVLSWALAGQATAVALTWLVSRHWLISAHSVAMGGTVALAMWLSRAALTSGWWLVAGAAALAAAVGYSRLVLRAHTPAQVWAGLALGLAVGLGVAAVM